jgi:hypothetical protein
MDNVLAFLPDGGHLAFTAFVDGAGGILKLTDGTVRHCWGASGDGEIKLMRSMM